MPYSKWQSLTVAPLGLTVAFSVAAFAGIAILINVLFMQTGQHPAPMFKGALTASAPAATKEMLGAVEAYQRPGGAAPAQPSAAVEQLLAFLQKLLGAPGAAPAEPPKAKALAGGEWSTAQFAPLLAAAPMLTQLMPLLQQVLTPETVKTLIGAVSPKEVIGAVTDSLKEIGKLGLENNKQLQDWLKKLDPGVDDAGLDRLLEGMSLGAAIPLARSVGSRATPEKAAAAEPSYRRVAGVTTRAPRVTHLAKAPKGTGNV